MELVVKENKKDFKIVLNKESIENSIDKLLEEFEENLYVKYGTSPEFGEKDFEYIQQEEYIKNVKEFKSDFLKCITNEELTSIVNSFPRKKNGTFNRRNVRELTSCNNCEVIHEWHNTWIYYVVKVVAFDDLTLVVELFKKTDTPG